MAEFNPDQYLAEKLGNQNQGFDPDAYLAEKTGQPAQAPWYQIENPNLKGYVKGALQSLPVAGGLIGGALATPETLGVGTIPGAAAGAAAGKSLQTIGEKYLLGEDVDRTKLYAGPAKEAAEMAAAEMGGQIIGKAIPAISSLAKISGEKPDAGIIKQSAKELGISPTAGMLSESPYIQKIESSLEQSPSIAGAMVRKETGGVRKGLSDAANNVFDQISYTAPSDVGSSVKKGLLETIQARLEPITEKFESVRGSTGFIDVNQKSTRKIAENIRNIDKLKSSPGNAIVNTIADDLESLKTVDDLKSLRTNIQARMRKPGIDPAEYSALSKAAEKVSNFEQNSIMREAVNQARTSKEGLEVGKQVVRDLKDARKDFRGLIMDIKDIGSGSNVAKNVKNIPQFLEKLESIPDEKIVDSLWKTDNRAYLNKLEKFDMDQFNKLREAKLLNIQQASEIKGKVDPGRFLKNVKNIEPETRKILFGPDHAEKIKHMETILNSLPDKIGPSGTPSGLEWSDLFSPSFWLQQAPRAAQYSVYKKPATINKAVGLLSGTDSGARGLINRIVPYSKVGGQD